MNGFVKFFLRNKSFTWLLLVLILLGGVLAYLKMGKLEDAPFTIKQALVITPYPGASPSEVQSQVTDVLEESLQSMEELYYLKSENRAGLSKITVFVKKELRADQMQQTWDKLRRKVGDVQGMLPQGAGTSVVKDDFGDVLGVFYGISSREHSYRELEEVAKELKNTLLKVKDVARVELYGIQRPAIDVTVDPAMMTRGGITVDDIMYAFEAHNRVVDAGGIEYDDSRIRIESTGSFYSIDDIRSLTITSSSGEHFLLSDIARVEESYITPFESMMRIDGDKSVGVAIATVRTGNVVDMAEAVALEIERFEERLPEGYAVSAIYDQGYESAVANRGFVVNLVVSVITVVIVLLFFIGLKNGILVGSGLVFSIFATLIVMNVQGIALQRMSLAAIIIAMGMLVDNAIVVSDSTLVNMQRGKRKRVSILSACSSTALPLLAATVIAILTFLPIYFSPHITGELLSSMVIVIGVSLMFSWVFAMSQTPFFIQEFVKRPKPDEVKEELFTGKMYDSFRRALRWVIRYKYLTIASLVLILILSAFSFKYIPKVFMPSLNKEYFTLDMWLPEGTEIGTSDVAASEICDYISGKEGVEMVSAFIGRTPPRYYLSNAAFGPQPNYAQILIKSETPEDAASLHGMLQDSIPILFPDPFIKVNKFEISPVSEALIEARFLGPDAAVLDSLTGVAIEIMRRNPKVADARCEWGNMAMMIRPVYDPVRAGALNISKAQMMESVKSISDGISVGLFRDSEKQVPVLLKSDVESLSDIGDFPVWNGISSVPLSQVTSDIEVTWEYPQIRTYNRSLSMAAMCGVVPGATMSEVHGEIRDEIEAMELPEGYKFFWDSQFKDQGEAMAALTKYFPLAFLILGVILVALFRNFREPLIIISILPLSVIGVVIGLMVTGFSFGFFAIAGWLGLLGMIIKNVIILIDEINILHTKRDMPIERAVIEATVSRTRPVLMAAITTIAGMIPLLFDVAFGGMAATIVFGLTFATILTLFATPAIFSVFYKIKISK